MSETAAATTLRGMIGETIPSGGTADDTLVSESQLEAWIAGSTSLDRAAISGWEFKLAEWVGLVNVSDGAASRSFSDLMDHAKYMISYYTSKAEGPTAGRSRVGKIVRS